MTLWTKLLFQAGKRLASDASAREKVAEAYRDAVKPEIDRTREDIRRIRSETDPKENPGRFAGRLARSLIDRAKDARK
jgi:hypothetical protein